MQVGAPLSDGVHGAGGGTNPLAGGGIPFGAIVVTTTFVSLVLGYWHTSNSTYGSALKTSGNNSLNVLVSVAAAPTFG